MLPELTFPQLPNWAKWLGAIISIIITIWGLIRWVYCTWIKEYRILRNRKLARHELKVYIRKLKESYYFSNHSGILMLVSFKSAADGLFCIPLATACLFTGIWLNGFEHFEKLPFMLICLGCWLYLAGWISLKSIDLNTNKYIDDISDMVLSEFRIQYLLSKSGLSLKRSKYLGRYIAKRVRREAQKAFSRDMLQNEEPIVDTDRIKMSDSQ